MGVRRYMLSSSEVWVYQLNAMILESREGVMTHAAWWLSAVAPVDVIRPRQNVL